MATQTQNGFKEIYLRLANEVYNASETEDWDDAYYQTMITLIQIDDIDIKTLLAGALSNFKYHLVKKCAIDGDENWGIKFEQMENIGMFLPQDLLRFSTPLELHMVDEMIGEYEFEDEECYDHIAGGIQDELYATFGAGWY